MAIRLYDEAIYNKIKDWTGDDRTRILNTKDTARLFRMVDSLRNDEVLTLPLISITRDSTVDVDVTTKRSLSFDGAVIGIKEQADGSSTPLVKQLNAIPISIKYQLDIYTKRHDEGDEYVRELLFKLINNPKLKITIPYNGTMYEHYANIRVSSSIIDNSDISERLFPDEFTRWTITFQLQDAYLFNIPIKTTKKMDNSTLEVQTSSNGVIEDISNETIK